IGLQLYCFPLLSCAFGGAIRSWAHAAALAGASDVATALAKPIFERQPSRTDSHRTVLNGHFIPRNWGDAGIQVGLLARSELTADGVRFLGHFVRGRRDVMVGPFTVLHRA